MMSCLLRAFLPVILSLWLITSNAFASADEVAERLRHRLEVLQAPGALVAGNEVLFAAVVLRELYEARGHSPLWVTEGVPSEALRGLPAAILAASREGLTPAHYHLAALERTLEWVASEAQPADPRVLVDLDLLASDAFLTLAHHYADGKVDPVSIDPHWFLARRNTNLLPLLDATVSGRFASVEEALITLLPSQPEYAALRDRLALQREFRDEDSWTRIPAGSMLREGDSGERVRALAARLAELGDLELAFADSEQFDSIKADAVRRFQTRHGLDADATVGPRTLAALNVSPTARIAQLKVNMERWRWLPKDLGEQHILVNIAGFYMVVRSGNEEVMRQPVVVGRPYRRTPVFSDRMTYLVLNPSWEVPPRLAAQDQLPLIKQDPGHLERMGFTVLRGWGAAEEVIDAATVDWLRLSARNFPYRLRQRPGPLNALGQAKFMFPNIHNVYLHDTPSRGLFQSADRAASSGCIRLSDPMALAHWLLAGSGRTPVMPTERIEQILASGNETTVRLRQSIPVHLLYWTAWIEADGRVHYTGDVYARDGPVLDALEQAPPTPRSLVVETLSWAP